MIYYLRDITCMLIYIQYLSIFMFIRIYFKPVVESLSTKTVLSFVLGSAGPQLIDTVTMLVPDVICLAANMFTLDTGSSLTWPTLFRWR